MKKTRLLLAVLLLFAYNCTKDESDIKEALKNTIWIDAKTGTDTLRFTDSMMYRGPKDYSGQQVLLCGQPYRTFIHII